LPLSAAGWHTRGLPLFTRQLWRLAPCRRKGLTISIEARVVDSHVAGDHTMFIAEIAGVRIREKDQPLTSLELEYVYVGGKELLKR
jgi:flavin reductase (DIM6/NTAB) family NADH-FMN oxidoreductase RutF